MEIKEISKREYWLVDGSLVVAVAKRHITTGWIITGGGISWASTKQKAMKQLRKHGDLI